VSTAVVVGAGVFGASVARELAKRGFDVTLAEQYAPGTVRSASGGDTRLLRAAHGGEDWYTQLAWRARSLWLDLQAETGVHIWEPTGLAWFAHADEGFELRSRAALERHPWAVEGLSEAYIGPNAIRHMEQSVATVDAIEGDFVTRFEIITMVDEYVFGYAMHRRAPGPDDPAAQQDWRERAFAFIDQQVRTGDFPHLSKLLPSGGIADLWERLEAVSADDERFERGLRRVLDGIQLELERSR
jgi:hypothetical protein